MNNRTGTAAFPPSLLNDGFGVLQRKDMKCLGYLLLPLMKR